MRIGFSDSELKTNSKYLPFEGRFLVRVKGIEYKEAKSSGNQVAHITFVGLGPHDGQTSFEMITMVQSQKWKLGKFLLACGFTEEQLMGGFDLDDSIGHTLVLVRERNGKTKTNEKTGKTYEDYTPKFERATSDQLEEFPHEPREDGGAAPTFSEQDIPF